MHTFKVDILVTVYESATIEVEAQDEQGALAVAEELYANDLTIPWRFDDVGDVSFEVRQ